MHSGWSPRLRAGAGAGAVQASAPGLSLVPCRRMHIPELEEAEQFAAGRGRALRLLEALYQCVAAHSELLCYFVIVLNHMVTASATSLVLPVLVFLWAMLSIPRPSKRFWMTAIVFTEVGVAGGVEVGVGCGRHADLSPLQVTVVAKYLFQFGFFPWNSHAVLRRYENKPYFPPRILGLEKSDSYVKYDLLQLMALFFHRAQLLVSAHRHTCTRRWTHGNAHTQQVCFRKQAGHSGAQGGPGHLTQPSVAAPASPACLTPQCYGLWDHEDPPLSKEHDRGSAKEKGAEEEPALPAPQEEPGGVARPPAEDHVQAEAKGGPLEPGGKRRISLRFRRRRKESTETRGQAIGTRAHAVEPLTPHGPHTLCW